MRLLQVSVHVGASLCDREQLGHGRFVSGLGSDSEGAMRSIRIAVRRDDEYHDFSPVDAGDVHGAVWLKSVAVQPDRTTCERKSSGARIPSVQIVGNPIDRPQACDDCGEQFGKLGFEVGGIRPPGAVDATDRREVEFWGSGLSLSRGIRGSLMP